MVSDIIYGGDLFIIQCLVVVDLCFLYEVTLWPIESSREILSLLESRLRIWGSPTRFCLCIRCKSLPQRTRGGHKQTLSCVPSFRKIPLGRSVRSISLQLPVFLSCLIFSLPRAYTLCFSSDVLCRNRGCLLFVFHLFTLRIYIPSNILQGNRKIYSKIWMPNI